MKINSSENHAFNVATIISIGGLVSQMCSQYHITGNTVAKPLRKKAFSENTIIFTNFTSNFPLYRFRKKIEEEQTLLRNNRYFVSIRKNFLLQLHSTANLHKIGDVKVTISKSSNLCASSVHNRRKDPPNFISLLSIFQTV